VGFSGGSDDVTTEVFTLAGEERIDLTKYLFLSTIWGNPWIKASIYEDSGSEPIRQVNSYLLHEGKQGTKKLDFEASISLGSYYFKIESNLHSWTICVRDY